MKEGFENNPICLCIFSKKLEYEFAIIAVYADDLNLAGTLEELIKTATYLKNGFEMKDLGRQNFVLTYGILVHQSTYTKKVLKHFYMEKAHNLSTPMVVRSLDVKKTIFALEKMTKKFLVLVVKLFT